MNLTAWSYAWIALITLSGIVGQWYGEGWEALWRFLAAGLISALALEGVLGARRPYALARKVPPIGHLGESLGGTLQVTHQGRDRLHLETQQRFPNGVMGREEPSRSTILPREAGEHPFSVVPCRLGRFEWQPVYTRFLGPFQLAWWPRKVEVPGSLQVVPSRLQNHERGSGVQDHGALTQRAAGSGKELLRLREYRPGDPLRIMDWKASARSGRHIVRVLTEEQHLEIMLLLDAGRTSGLQAGALTRLSHYVNVGARLAEKAIGNGDRVGLVVFAEQPLEVQPPVQGQTGLVKIRRVLEKLDPSPREANPLAATLTAQKLLRRRSLVVMFTEMEETDTAGQVVQATQLLASKHLPLIAGIIDPDIVALQHHPAKNWLDPYTALAASETLQASRGNVLKLQRMGAAVALADPAQLDGMVLGYYQNFRNRKRV